MMMMKVLVTLLTFELMLSSSSSSSKESSPLPLMYRRPSSSSSSSSVCEFPSLYKDKVIHQCQPGGPSGQWWCPREDNYDLYNQRAPCPNTSLTYAGSDPGRYCHFPFMYQGREHWSCIRATEGGPSHVYWWCATTRDYDQDRSKRWTRCREHSPQLPCFFRGEEESAGISGQCRQFVDKWVCHTERGEIRECPSTRTTFAGNHPGHQCHFPFIFGHKEYRSCISVRRRPVSPSAPSIMEEGGHPEVSSAHLFESYLWCSTTSNYDTDRRWTRCKEEEPSFLGLADRRVLVPASVVLGVVLVVLALATLVHFFCDHHPHSSSSKTHQHLYRERPPCLHISMLDLPPDSLPKAPPSYLEAVSSLSADHHLLRP